MSLNNAALIVDDALFMREVIRDALSSLFPNILEESCYESAWQTYVSDQPYLITIDLSLNPNESLQGLKLAKKIKKADKPNRVIVISALDQKKIRDHAFESGVDSYMVKPIDKKELQEMVKSFLEDTK